MALFALKIVQTAIKLLLALPNVKKITHFVLFFNPYCIINHAKICQPIFTAKSPDLYESFCPNRCGMDSLAVYL